MSFIENLVSASVSITEDKYVFPYTSVVDLPLKAVFKNKNRVQIETYSQFFKLSKIKTIVVESYYIDRHHDDDLANYYYKSFRPYSRYCKRYHFFSKIFDQLEFEQLIAEVNETDDKSEIEESYVGFLVQRGIQSSEIARTCLKPYDEYENINGAKNRIRYFQCLRNYNVNLLGLTLKVESLAYQEQDGAVALCASSAIWSTIHKTSRLFHHTVVSPSEITKRSVKYSKEVRKFPNSGLTVDQMGAGLSVFGLEPLIIVPNSAKVVKSIVGAYIGMGIPIIMALKYLNKKRRNLHAVTITGYNIKGGQKEVYIRNDIKLASNKITHFYCHDDQIRPFSKVEISSYQKKDNKAETIVPIIKTSWSFDDVEEDDEAVTKRGSENAEITALIIPLNDIIRITFDDVRNEVLKFNYFLNLHKKREYKYEWSISIWNVNSFKKNIKKNEFISSGEKILMCKRFLPKYVWRAIASENNKRIFEFVFDATDKKEDAFYIDYLAYNYNEFGKTAYDFVNTYGDERIKVKNRSSSLDKLFGQLFK